MNSSSAYYWSLRIVKFRVIFIFRLSGRDKPISPVIRQKRLFVKYCLLLITPVCIFSQDILGFVSFLRRILLFVIQMPLQFSLNGDWLIHSTESRIHGICNKNAILSIRHSKVRQGSDISQLPLSQSEIDIQITNTQLKTFS